MKCPRCGNDIPSKANFCPDCGQRITNKDRNDFLNEMIRNPQMEGEAPNFETDYEPIQMPQGSWFGGIMLGLFLNVIGVMIAIFTRGRNTKRGAGIGFFVSSGLIILGIIQLFIYFNHIHNYGF